MIGDAGPDASVRFLGVFFAGRANERTRAAYGRAVGQFLGWAEARAAGLDAVSSLHVAHVPTVKQHLAAIRMLRDWLEGLDAGPLSGRGPAVPAGEPGVWRRLHEALDAYLEAGGSKDARDCFRAWTRHVAGRPGGR